jgi:hypothetical protein
MIKIIRPYPSPFLVSSPVAFKFLNVLVLNIAEKLLAERSLRVLPASSTTKTGHHDIAEILLKVALNTKIQIQTQTHN